MQTFIITLVAVLGVLVLLQITKGSKFVSALRNKK